MCQYAGGGELQIAGIRVGCGGIQTVDHRLITIRQDSIQEVDISENEWEKGKLVKISFSISSFWFKELANRRHRRISNSVAIQFNTPHPHGHSIRTSHTSRPTPPLLHLSCTWVYLHSHCNYDSEWCFKLIELFQSMYSSSQYTLIGMEYGVDDSVEARIHAHIRNALIEEEKGNIKIWNNK